MFSNCCARVCVLLYPRGGESEWPLDGVFNWHLGSRDYLDEPVCPSGARSTGCRSASQEPLTVTVDDLETASLEQGGWASPVGSNASAAIKVIRSGS
ncbi:unnamed protein product [Schistocephalus solidus]|uniref:Uncharacterized protein n=1 Tax=Schistocephalus solidus TaxID=70667 RepID=A0A183SFY0_SCHSO|nr:unnamed protein product [Schistocephalus solidus]